MRRAPGGQSGGISVRCRNCNYGGRGHWGSGEAVVTPLWCGISLFGMQLALAIESELIDLWAILCVAFCGGVSFGATELEGDEYDCTWEFPPP
jgi:hypothetical protein